MFNIPTHEGALFVSSSFLDIACPRAQQHYKIDARVSMFGSSALGYGSHLHAALKAHYTKSGDPHAALDAAWDKAPVEDAFRTREWAHTELTQYLDRWKTEDWEVVRLANGNYASEMTFTAPLTQVGELPVYYHGIVDLLVRRGNLLWVLDFKTTSKLGQSYWDDKRMLSSVRGYAWALTPHFPHDKIHGYTIRAIRTTPPPKKLAEGTPGEIKKWWSETLGEQEYQFSAGELEEWRINTIRQVEEFVWRAGRGYFPMQRSLCVGKYGRCPYYDVCSSSPEGGARERILGCDLFKTKEQTITKHDEND